MVVTTMTHRRLLRTHEELLKESDAAFDFVDSLDELEWQSPTVVPGWTVRDHVAHLARFDEAARVALTNPSAFRRLAELDQATQPWFPSHLGKQISHLPSEGIADWFNRARRALLDAYRHTPAETTTPWYGSDRTPEFSAALRLMETWLHIQDIVDALEGRRESVPTVLHGSPYHEVADTTCFALPHIAPADRGIRIELITPRGDLWSWGSSGDGSIVSGSAVDFCLVLSGRRRADEVTLAVEGTAARRLCGLS